MMRSIRWRLVGSVAAVGVIAGSGACNYHWYPYGTTYQYNEISLVSAVPAVKDSQGNFVPQCEPGAQATAMLLSVNILGTEQQEGSEVTDIDQDVSMRPGDVLKTIGSQNRFVLKEGDSIREEHFKVELKCLEPYPDDTSVSSCNSDDGVANPGGGGSLADVTYSGFFAPDAEGFYPRTFKDANKIGVAILIDQSGSMKGFVDKVTDKEVKQDLTPSPWDLSNFRKYASDKNNQRLSSVRTFMNSLNAREKAIVFQFGEVVGTTPKVVCANPDGKAEAELRRDCYGTNRDIVLGSATVTSEIDKLQATPRGRTPLWAAVDDVYTFMRDEASDTEVRHIVIIGDGPDTCFNDSPDYASSVVVTANQGGKEVTQLLGQGLCSNVGYAAVKQKILTDLASGTAPKVRISFVQFQAPGYLDRDPRQQELACLTGGQYVFVNAEDLPKDQDQALEEALRNAMMRIRYSLAGSWQMAIDLPDLVNVRLPRGAQIAVAGSLTLLGAENSLTLEDQILNLGIGQFNDDAALGNLLGRLDMRPAVRLPCGTTDPCAWYPTADACEKVACEDVGFVCRFRPGQDLDACTDGVCCGGDCFVGGATCTPASN